MQQEFKVQGMTCGHCVKAVTQAVQLLDNTAVGSVELDSGKVVISSGVSRERLVEAIRDEGYAVVT
ncbi:MAG: cation transporter [Burkholderiales bacterium]|nr:cation transporter [Burkholderiales bacterium]